jgi:hypothetical protein
VLVVARSSSDSLFLLRDTAEGPEAALVPPAAAPPAAGPATGPAAGTCR